MHRSPGGQADRQPQVDISERLLCDEQVFLVCLALARGCLLQSESVHLCEVYEAGVRLGQRKNGSWWVLEGGLEAALSFSRVGGGQLELQSVDRSAVEVADSVGVDCQSLDLSQFAVHAQRLQRCLEVKLQRSLNYGAVTEFEARELLKGIN